MQRIIRRITGPGGFTMLELISVLLLIGILGAVVMSRHGGSAADADVIANREVLKSHIRYAQSRSMHADRIWGIQFNGATYQLFSYDSEVSDLTTPTFPNYNSTSVPMPAGMTATGVVAFDFFGRPYYAADLGSPGSLKNTSYAGQIVTLTPITITPDTGFVP